MSSEMITKRKIDQFVRSIACEGRKRFTASFISKNVDVESDFVKERLLQLSDDGQLITNFELMCPSRECEFRTIKTYQKIEDVPIDQYTECPECGEEFIGLREHVWISFTPNTDYFDKEMCAGAESVKKNKIQRTRTKIISQVLFTSNFMGTWL